MRHHRPARKLYLAGDDQGQGETEEKELVTTESTEESETGNRKPETHSAKLPRFRIPD